MFDAIFQIILILVCIIYAYAIHEYIKLDISIYRDYKTTFRQSFHMFIKCLYKSDNDPLQRKQYKKVDTLLNITCVLCFIAGIIGLMSC